MSFPRYPKYKSSGEEWLGKVPAHWELRRLGYFFRERNERGSAEEFLPLSVTQNGIVPQLETAAKSDDTDNRKLVRSGDFVINSRSDRRGSAGLSGVDGSVSLISIVLEPSQGIWGSFAHHLLRSVPFQDEFYRVGKGIVADLWSTRYVDMRNILVAAPPIHEQQGIGEFLDRETAKIDALLAEQERLIELLQEKRQAVISHAVTKGLNPDAPMKPSGVEWLGEVPAHWDVKRIKDVTANVTQGWSPQCENVPAESDAEWSVLKVGCVNGGRFNWRENKLLPETETPADELTLRSGDLLVSRANTRELVGGAAVVDRDYPRLMLCDKLYRLTLVPSRASPTFVSYYLSSAAARSQIELAATGASASMVNISQSTVLDLPVPLPPRDEQGTLVDGLEDAILGFDALLKECLNAVALLRERRSALISAAVTGQIDVRGLAQGKAA